LKYRIGPVRIFTPDLKNNQTKSNRNDAAGIDSISSEIVLEQRQTQPAGRRIFFSSSAMKLRYLYLETVVSFEKRGKRGGQHGQWGGDQLLQVRTDFLLHGSEPKGAGRLQLLRKSPQRRTLHVFHLR
jgi:hypothetical protein